MKIAIVAGGGGHFNPAFALMQSLPKDIDVLLIGRKHAFEGDRGESLEYRTARKQGTKFFAITSARLQRTFTPHTVPSLLKLPLGFYQALAILRMYKPDVLFSTGGYIAVPVVFAAYILRIPVVLHEQTFDAGLSNKITSRIAKKICISWKSSENYFPKGKTVLTGNPIKKYQISNIKYQISNEQLPLIYITGGSGGSHMLNTLVFGCLEKLLENYRIIHQTGDAQEFKDYDKLFAKRDSLPESLQKRYTLTKFIAPNDVASVLKIADVVVSRAGMNTVTELLYFKRPALLIPLPFAQADEQKKNARFLKNAGLAEVLEQNATLDTDAFFSALTKLVDSRKNYVLKKIDDYPNPERAAEKILEVISNVAQKKEENTA